MKYISLALLVVFSVLFPSFYAHAESINAVVGDSSWRELGHGDMSKATEKERIRTHLKWVEAKLRKADTSAFTSAAAARRVTMLNALRVYRLAGAFPQHERVGQGRSPRWVDHEGRICAVGHLVALSGASDLFKKVAREHEYDYVPDMKVPALGAWASKYGFTVTELAMIQPRYRDRPGPETPRPISEFERRMREEEEKRKRLIPRPLKVEDVDNILASFADRDMKRSCFGRQTGRWDVKVRATITKKVKARIKVDVYREGSKKRLEAESLCMKKALKKALNAHLKFANHTVKKKFTRTHAFVLESPDKPAIVKSFFARPLFEKHKGLTREAALAKCIASSSDPNQSLSVPIRISSWNGRAIIQWPKVPPRKDEAARKLWYCVQDVLVYEDSRVHGVWDLNLTLRIDPRGAMEVL